MKSLTVTVNRLEDRVSPVLLAEWEAPPAKLDDAVLAWFRMVAIAASNHPDMRCISPEDEIESGDLVSVEILICSPDAMENLFDADRTCLGFHNLSNPDCDPFRENSGEARAFRIMIAWDTDLVWQHICDADPDDAENGAMAWLTTFTHELHHVRLFAENGNFNSPADLDLMQDETGRDLFDISSGYGIRGLMFDGDEIWSDSAEHAEVLMEDYVEERGRQMAQDLFLRDLAPSAFLKIFDFPVQTRKTFESDSI